MEVCRFWVNYHSTVSCHHYALKKYESMSREKLRSQSTVLLLCVPHDENVHREKRRKITRNNKNNPCDDERTVVCLERDACMVRVGWYVYLPPTIAVQQQQPSLSHISIRQKRNQKTLFFYEMMIQLYINTIL